MGLVYVAMSASVIHSRKLRGVERAEVNYVSGSATVVYDETVIDLNTIRAKVHECGYHCSGELVPRHLCKPGNPPPKGRDNATNGTVIDEKRHRTEYERALKVSYIAACEVIGDVTGILNAKTVKEAR